MVKIRSPRFSRYPFNKRLFLIFRYTTNSSLYPCTLVSDYGVSMYVCTRQDMLRRLPKRLLTALGEPKAQTLLL